MKKIAAEIEETEMGFIARTHDVDVVKTAGCHLYACGKTPDMALSRLCHLVEQFIEQPVDAVQTPIE